MALRGAQLICAVVLIGVATHYVKDSDTSIGHRSRFIFTDVAAALSAFFAFIWILPFSSNHMNWSIDLFIALGLAGASGWLIYRSEDQCGKATTSDVGIVTKFRDEHASDCTKWRALYIFAVVSTALWILSAVIGYFWVKKHTVKARSKTKTKGRH
ncbi:hypothetical protein QQZ08_000530 [Neonectria magnoliae]|uniref:MARVEL domain-containing protein n=1 Tax=Neonectria magnoliae TaxID=2732573 RepID=A0ABR1IJF7_9HYPO